jgi:hypothetical protein
MKRLLFAIGVLCAGMATAQQGSVEVKKDPRMDALIRQEGAVIPPAMGPQITGYRIQLFFDTSKDAVDDARSRFISLNPKVDTYVIYNAPNYFLKVGDFRTQMEAEKIKAAVDSQFPTSFIVKEKVNLPRIDQ